MKKIKLYQVYPLISSCSFILAQLFITNYSPREFQPVFQYLYFNILFPVAYMFFYGLSYSFVFINKSHKTC